MLHDSNNVLTLNPVQTAVKHFVPAPLGLGPAALLHTLHYCWSCLVLKHNFGKHIKGEWLHIACVVPIALLETH